MKSLIMLTLHFDLWEVINEAKIQILKICNYFSNQSDRHISKLSQLIIKDKGKNYISPHFHGKEKKNSSSSFSNNY